MPFLCDSYNIFLVKTKCVGVRISIFSTNALNISSSNSSSNESLPLMVSRISSSLCFNKSFDSMTLSCPWMSTCSLECDDHPYLILAVHVYSILVHLSPLCPAQLSKAKITRYIGNNYIRNMFPWPHPTSKLSNPPPSNMFRWPHLVLLSWDTIQSLSLKHVPQAGFSCAYL